MSSRQRVIVERSVLLLRARITSKILETAIQDVAWHYQQNRAIRACKALLENKTEKNVTSLLWLPLLAPLLTMSSRVFRDPFFTNQHLCPDVLNEMQDGNHTPSIYVSYVSITQKIDNKRVVTRTRQLISYNRTGKVHMSEKREIGRHSVKYIKDVDEDGTERTKKELSAVEEDELSEFAAAWAEKSENLPDDKANFMIDDVETKRKRPRRLEENRSAAVFNLKPAMPKKLKPQKHEKQQKKVPLPKPKVRSVSPAPAAKISSPAKTKHSNERMFIARHDDELECLRQVNEYRKMNGKPPLAWNDKLRDITLPHTIAMRNKECPVDHTNFKQRCEQMPGITLGENVGYNQGEVDPIRKMMVGWIRSLHHRENILGNFNAFGVTFAYGPDERWYGTQLFAFIPSGKMSDAIPLSRSEQKELLTAINRARHEAGLGELAVLPAAQRVLAKYARRLCCGKQKIGEGTISDRSKLIFDSSGYSYTEVVGAVPILGNDYVNILATNWITRKDGALMREGDTHIGFGVAYDDRGVYYYALGLIKLP